MRARHAIFAALLVVLPAGGLVALVGEPAIGKADRVLQDAMDRAPVFVHVRLPDSVGDDDELVQEYTWVYRGIPYAWRVGVPREDVARAASAERVLDPRTYGLYVTDGERSVARIADGLTQLAESKGYDDEARLNLALAFVQGLTYVTDAEGAGAEDYPKFPAETLADGAGDCEDTAALYASIVRAMGHEATLLLLDGHMAAGVRLDGVRGPLFDGWLYAETTRAGYRIGEVAWEFRGAGARPLDVVTVPALDVAWTAAANKWGFVVRLDVYNNGTAAARDVSLYAGAAPRGGEWEGVFATVGDLPPGGHASRWVWVDVPPDRAAALRALAWAHGVETVGHEVPVGPGVTAVSSPSR